MYLRIAAVFLAAFFVMNGSAKADIFTADVNNGGGGNAFSAGISGVDGLSGDSSATINLGTFSLGGENVTISADVEVIGSGFLHNLSINGGTANPDNILGIYSEGDSGAEQSAFEGGEGIRFSNVSVTSASGNAVFKSFRAVGFVGAQAGSTADITVGGSNFGWTEGNDVVSVGEGDPVGTIDGFDLFSGNGSNDVTEFDFVHTGGQFSFSSIQIEVVSVPEPSSLLALAALGGVALAVRRKK